MATDQNDRLLERISDQLGEILKRLPELAPVEPDPEPASPATVVVTGESASEPVEKQEARAGKPKTPRRVSGK